MHRNIYKTLSILIVENDKNTVEYLSDIMSLYFKSIYLAKNGCIGLEKFKKYSPDIIISDIEMLCLDGIEMIHRAKKIRPSIVTVLCSAHTNTEYLLSAIDIKVDAYLIKPIDINLLFDKFYSNLYKVTSNIYNQQNHKILSNREYEVFLDIAKGIKQMDIALKYNIKPKTVGTYRRRILEKMNFSANADITHYSVQNSLI